MTNLTIEEFQRIGMRRCEACRRIGRLREAEASYRRLLDLAKRPDRLKRLRTRLVADRLVCRDLERA